MKEGETTNDIFAFLTTDPNAEVGVIHPKAMPVILTKPEEREAWMKAPAEEALRLQRPLLDGALRIVARGEKQDGAEDVGAPAVPAPTKAAVGFQGSLFDWPAARASRAFERGSRLRTATRDRRAMSHLVPASLDPKETLVPGPLETVETYFRAKDGNRPFLMRRAFAPEIELEMIVKTDAIDFPPHSKGLAAIEDVLCRRFANDCENVYTFCFSQPTEADRRHFPCHWLVGMSAKGNGPLRVGCGRYDWYFTSDERCLTKRLVITIETMQLLPPTSLDEVMGWLSALPYPWCTPERALDRMPQVESLGPIRAYLTAYPAVAPA